MLVTGKGRVTKSKTGTKKYWKCLCDCGKELEVVTHCLVKKGQQSCGCFRADMCREKTGVKHHSWKGGRINMNGGYVGVRIPDHPNATKQGYVLEHVVVMSEVIGRPLKEKETVHHINGVKDDNREENLELWSHSHPCGQRIKDKIKWCEEFLKEYAPKKLK